jgi:hypothetical protein
MKSIRNIVYPMLIYAQLVSCKYHEPLMAENEYVKKQYYNNGKLKSETTYRDSIRNGPLKEYFFNGSLSHERYFKDDALNCDAVDYNENGIISTKAFFWRDKNVGPIYYYANGHLILYNERDYLGNICYVKKYDTVGKLIKEEGIAISPNIYSNIQGDTIERNHIVSFYCFYTEPEGYHNILQGFINDSIINVQRIQNGHICYFVVFLSRHGKYIFNVNSSLKKGDNIITQNHCIKEIFCR